jgi:hypothetical protein
MSSISKEITITNNILTLKLTLFEVTSKATPRGMNPMPMAKNAGRTVLAVRMGCHAASFCCLNLVSGTQQELH